MLYLSLKRAYNIRSGFTKRSRIQQECYQHPADPNHLYYGASQMTYLYLTPNPIRCKVNSFGGGS